MFSDLASFLKSDFIAVLGVSRNSKKFGNFLFDELKKKGKKVFPVNPHLIEYDGVKCFQSVEDLPEETNSVVFVTKPEITNTLLLKVFQKGIRNIWLQQGSHNNESIAICSALNVNVIHGQCLMMYLEPVKSFHKFHQFLWKLFGKYVG